MSHLRKWHVKYRLAGEKKVSEMEIFCPDKLNKRNAARLVAQARDTRPAVVEIRKIEEKIHS